MRLLVVLSLLLTLTACDGPGKKVLKKVITDKVTDGTAVDVPPPNPPPVVEPPPPPPPTPVAVRQIAPATVRSKVVTPTAVQRRSAKQPAYVQKQKRGKNSLGGGMKFS